MGKEKRKNLQIFVWFLIAAAILLIKYSGCSPAYFTNTWVDTNANMTVGKSILDGIVPYKDLFEQRGPWLYFINAFCSLFKAGNPFFGVYLYEVLCGGVFLYFCWKTILVFSRKSADIFVITSPLYFWLLLQETSFGGGGSPEELCLPALMCSLFLLIRSIHQKKLLTFREGILIGICAGYVFWIKYNMMGFFAGAAIAFLIGYGMKFEWKQIGSVLLGVICGIEIMTVPVLLYYGWNHALPDLFRVYFYDNIFYYTYDRRILYKLYFSAIHIIDSIKANRLMWMMTIAGGIFCLICLKEKFLVLFFLITGALHVIFVYQGGQPYPYYGYSFAIYSATGYLWLNRLTCPDKAGKIISATAMALCIIPAWKAISAHLKSDRNDLVQYRFTDEMGPDATLLNYFHIDIGFYNAGSLIPPVYYSWDGNLMGDEIREVQDQYIQDRKTEYIVSQEELPSDLLMDNYRLIDEYDDLFLYQRK